MSFAREREDFFLYIGEETKTNTVKWFKPFYTGLAGCSFPRKITVSGFRGEFGCKAETLNELTENRGACSLILNLSEVRSRWLGLNRTHLLKHKNSGKAGTLQMRLTSYFQFLQKSSEKLSLLEIFAINDKFGLHDNQRFFAKFRGTWQAIAFFMMLEMIF